MTPRFLLVCGVVRDGFAHPAWPDVSSPLAGEPASDGTWLSWRLTGANHRELGRSVRVFPTVDEVMADVDELRQGSELLVRMVAASPRDARWTWRVGRDGTTLAASSRAYARNRECLYNLETFMSAVGVAEVSDVVPASRFMPQLRQAAVPAVIPVVPAPAAALDAAIEASIDAAGYAG